MADEKDKTAKSPEKGGEGKEQKAFEITPAMKKQAQRWFEQGQTVLDTGNHDYAIRCMIEGLQRDPENIEAHQKLREISAIRKASGGKKAGMFEKSPVSKKDRLGQMLSSEYMLAKDPENPTYMEQMVRSADKLGLTKTLTWIAPFFFDANARQKRPSLHRFLLLTDVYEKLGMYDKAIEACRQAEHLNPESVDLGARLKDLSALHVMRKGKYGEAGSFREGVADMDEQMDLHQQDQMIQSEDWIAKQINKARADYEAEPNHPGKINGYVEALLRRERQEEENQAIEVLEKAFKQSNQFRFRQRAGDIRIRQFRRTLRPALAKAKQEPDNQDLARKIKEFRQKQLAFELKHFTQCWEHYPTDMRFRFEMGRRLLEAGKIDEAIEAFQQSQTDPKNRFTAMHMLGLCFYQKLWYQEAADTFRRALGSYEIEGDTISKELNYWLGRSLESAGQNPEALKQYSHVAMLDYNFRDVRQRVETLRTSVAQQV